jgi:hypothetical protein
MQGGGIGNRNHPRHRSSSIRYFLPAANNRWVLLLVCVVCLFRGGARANELWLSSVDPVTRAAHKWDASADYMELFHSDAKWKTVASSIRVFKIGPGFVQQGKEEDLRLIFSELQRHNIKLALEIGMVTRSEHCQQHSEAYGPQGLVEQLLRRVERLGGDLAYIAMDEPLYYGGNQYKGGDACNLSVRQIAADVAPNVKLAKSIFPNVKIGDIEVIYFSKESARHRGMGGCVPRSGRIQSGIFAHGCGVVASRDGKHPTTIRFPQIAPGELRDHLQRRRRRGQY